LLKKRERRGNKQEIFYDMRALVATIAGGEI
jgi:hypothetical protein